MMGLSSKLRPHPVPLGRLFRAATSLLVGVHALCFPRAVAAAVEENVRTVSSFAEVRTALLEGIAGASRRIWMVTDYLTDGELVSALYVARYRKLDVQVLLGRAKANLYMSRLSYLKNQNIPVFLKPDGLRTSQPSAVLCDDRLLLVDSDLNFLNRVRQFKVSLGDDRERDVFVQTFAAAIERKIPAFATPLPLVGRPNPGAPIYSPKGPPPPGRGSDGRTAGDGYYYGQKAHPRPADVPTKLPKNLKWDRPFPPPGRQGAPSPDRAVGSGDGKVTPPPAASNSTEARDEAPNLEPVAPKGSEPNEPHQGGPDAHEPSGGG